MSTGLNTPGTPLYVRLVRDEAGAVRPGRMLTALLFTAALAYVSVAVQRGASNPDLTRSLKMRGALAVKHYAEGMSSGWADVAARAATLYQRARL